MCYYKVLGGVFCFLSLSFFSLMTVKAYGESPHALSNSPAYSSHQFNDSQIRKAREGKLRRSGNFSYNTNGIGPDFSIRWVEKGAVASLMELDRVSAELSESRSIVLRKIVNGPVLIDVYEYDVDPNKNYCISWYNQTYHDVDEQHLKVAIAPSGVGIKPKWNWERPKNMLGSISGSMAGTGQNPRGDKLCFQSESEGRVKIIVSHSGRRNVAYTLSIGIADLFEPKNE